MYLRKLFLLAALSGFFCLLGFSLPLFYNFVAVASAVFVATLVWYWLCTCCIMVVTADCFDFSCKATLIQFVSAPGDGTMLARTCFLPLSFS
jgi:hypothetical protein